MHCNRNFENMSQRRSVISIVLSVDSSDNFKIVGLRIHLPSYGIKNWSHKYYFSKHCADVTCLSMCDF